MLSFLAYQIYQRLVVSKISGSAHRHNTSGLCELTIQTVLTMRTCDMAEAHHHISWFDRVPNILWSLNTSICASTGYSPFYLEHGRDPRDVASRAMDTSDVPAPSARWCEVVQQRLALARKVQRTERMGSCAARTCLRRQSVRHQCCSPALFATKRSSDSRDRLRTV